MIRLWVCIYCKCNKNINILQVWKFFFLALASHLKWQERQIWSPLNNRGGKVENCVLKIIPHDEPCGMKSQ